MKGLIKRIEEATKYKVVVLSERKREDRDEYQIALISDEIGSVAYFHLIHTDTEERKYWYIREAISLLGLNYGGFKYTIEKVEEELEK